MSFWEKVRRRTYGNTPKLVLAWLGVNEQWTLCWPVRVSWRQVLLQRSHQRSLGKGVDVLNKVCLYFLLCFHSSLITVSAFSLCSLEDRELEDSRDHMSQSSLSYYTLSSISWRIWVWVIFSGKHFCLLMAFSRRWLYKQPSLCLCHPAPVLFFMTKSLQQHQSLMTK